MAGTPSGVTNQSLEQILGRTVAWPVYRDAAAALTVAFEIRKAIALYHGETKPDEQIKQEVTKVYQEFMAVTDPKLGLQAAAQKQAQQKL